MTGEAKDDQLAGVKAELAELEGNLQATLQRMHARIVSAKIVTFQYQHERNGVRRPGFFREELTIDKHVEIVTARAEREGTSGTLNFRNWTSVVNYAGDMQGATMKDVNTVVQLSNQFKTLLRLVQMLGAPAGPVRAQLAGPAIPVPVAPAELPALPELPAFEEEHELEADAQDEYLYPEQDEAPRGEEEDEDVGEDEPHAPSMSEPDDDPDDEEN